MSAKNRADDRPRAKDKPDKSRPKDGGKRGQAPGELGSALKSVYDNTLREEVPKDFLDLLGKLS